MQIEHFIRRIHQSTDTIFAHLVKILNTDWRVLAGYITWPEGRNNAKDDVLGGLYKGAWRRIGFFALIRISRPWRT